MNEPTAMIPQTDDLIRAFWENHWARNRVNVIALGVLITLVTAFAKLVDNIHVWGQVADRIIVMFYSSFWAGLVIGCLLFLFRQVNADAPQSANGSVGNGSAYPFAMMLLPVSDAALVIGQMLLSALTLAMLVGIAWLEVRLLFSSKTAVWVADFGVSFLCVMICLQTITWSPIRSAYLKPILVTLLLLGSIFGPGLFAVKNLSIETFMATLGVLAGLCVPGAILGVSTARHGKPPLVQIDLLPKLGRSETVPDWKPFRTKFSTQVWADFRRYGKAVVWVIFILSVIEIFVTVLNRGYERGIGYYGSQGEFQSQAEWMIGIAFFTCFLLGSIPRRTDMFKPNRSLQPFLATRPLSGTDVMRSLFACSGITALISWALLTAALLFWFYSPLTTLVPHLQAGGVDFDFSTPKQVLLIMVSLAWFYVLLWNSLTLLLTAEITGDAAVALGFVVGVGAILFQVGMQHQGNADLAMPYDLFTMLMCLAIVVKLGLAGVVATIGFRRGLFDAKYIAATSISWLVVTAALTAAFQYSRPSILEGAVQFLPGVILSVPLARFYAAPLAYEWNRHE